MDDPRIQEIPYGLQVGADCCSLVENTAETRVLKETARLLVDDMPLSRIAAELNNLGYRTRREALWTPTEVFKLLPRMIDAGNRLFRD